MESRVTHSLVTALRDVPGFESVDERVLLALIGESANLYWPEGSTVFRHGTPADGLYIVISGAVRVVGEDGVTRGTLAAARCRSCSGRPTTTTWWSTRTRS